MTIEIDTGSTVYWTIRQLGAMVFNDGLRGQAVLTSKQTENLAGQFGIPLGACLDLPKGKEVIDGTGEISPELD
jgi:ribose 5-phosphate isomerase A